MRRGNETVEWVPSVVANSPTSVSASVFDASAAFNSDVDSGVTWADSWLDKAADDVILLTVVVADDDDDDDDDDDEDEDEEEDGADDDLLPPPSPNGTAIYRGLDASNTA